MAGRHDDDCGLASTNGSKTGKRAIWHRGSEWSSPAGGAVEPAISPEGLRSSRAKHVDPPGAESLWGPTRSGAEVAPGSPDHEGAEDSDWEVLRRLADSKAVLSSVAPMGAGADLEDVLATAMVGGPSFGKVTVDDPPSSRDGHGGRRWLVSLTVILTVTTLLVAGEMLYLRGWLRPGAKSPVTSPGATNSVVASSAATCSVATVADLASTMTVAHGSTAATGSYGISGPLGGYGLAFDGSLSWLETSGAGANVPQVYTELAWFRTFSSTIQPILGSANRPSPGEATAADRALWLDGGHVVAGVFSESDNVAHELVSPSSYDDGEWHLAAVTLSGTGFVLYVDGRRVDASPTVTSAQKYTGWWAVGAANLGSWPRGLPARGVGYWRGGLAGVGVLPLALTADQVHDLYTSPTLIGYGAAVTAKNPVHYWGLQDVTPHPMSVRATDPTATCPGRS